MGAPTPLESLQAAQRESMRMATGSWAEDLLIALHNSVRKELADLFTILIAIYSRKARTTREEDSIFSDWWMALSGFISMHFTMEEQVLMPLVQPTAYADPELTVGVVSINENRAELQKRLRDINDSVDWLFLRRMRDAIGAITRGLDAFVRLLLEHYKRQEALLPHYIVAYHGQSQEQPIRRALVATVRKSARPDLFTVMLVSWTDNRRWRRKFLSGIARLQYPRWEAGYQERRSVVLRFQDEESIRAALSRSSSLSGKEFRDARRASLRRSVSTVALEGTRSMK
eukprot:Plantae.Rhodophyta-Rhodochaete_pulchella.ctg19980.p1 GENE.Plantae.Rhodophyta-Rhodochaete_pulchella.ctg19980~~Plantae.Rhodophyta-Rhodochaete_pulchella.ctg19980.p1  ORF type:complete len:286 (+),score=23.55 Plantae.Rhodophyta-Rhodochaete_pulchella.ctg19980:348-1205(+)